MMFYAWDDILLFSNFHLPWSGLRWLRANVWLVASKLDVPAQAITAVRQGGLLEIRAFAPPGHSPRFASGQFCFQCECETCECECIKAVMNG